LKAGQWFPIDLEAGQWFSSGLEAGQWFPSGLEAGQWFPSGLEAVSRFFWRLDSYIDTTVTVSQIYFSNVDIIFHIA